MNKIVTSENEILTICKKIVNESGLQAVSMRTVAKRCNVAVGSIYNYFASKDDLLISTIKSIWFEILDNTEFDSSTPKFTDYLIELFTQIKNGCQKYPHFFTMHSLSFSTNNKELGRQNMNIFFDKIKNNMLSHLENDSSIKPSVFSNDFTKSALVDFIFSNFINCLIDQNKSIDFLITLTTKVLY